MTLKDDKELIKNYIKVHSPSEFWPEIAQGMREVGILNMELYIMGTRLFMIMDTITNFDHEKAMQELATKPRQAEWEAYVSKFQHIEGEITGTEKWHLVDRIFHMN